jgi:septal ring factor EnvC (AmiA/AmiB activator)
LEKSESEAKGMKNESKLLRSELESVRNALASSNYAIEKLSSDRANLEAEMRKIRRNESNLLDQAALREMSVPAVNKDRFFFFLNRFFQTLKYYVSMHCVPVLLFFSVILTELI